MVVADLFFAGEHVPHVAGPALPGLARLARFAAREAVPRGWRAWVAGRLGREDLAAAPPAAVAAAALPPSADAQVWLAAPVHLSVSLRSVHLDPHGLLRLDAQAQGRLAESFGAHFAGRRLAPASGGGFLLYGPRIEGITRTTDPARCLGASLAAVQPLGPGGAQLQRLSAQIEMWLHAHPLNAERARAGEPTVSALWLWGGVPAGEPLIRADARERPAPRAELFGDDAYLAGLAALTGSACGPAPAALAGSALPQGMTVIAVELFRERVDRSPSPQGALAGFDRDFITPALAAVRRAEVDRLTLIANDRALRVRRWDRLRLWRRSRGALEALG